MSVFFFFKQKTAYEMRISDWSSDVCSSDLAAEIERCPHFGARVVDEACHQPPAEQADRQIDEEDPAPRGVSDDQAADRRAENRSKQCRYRQPGHCRNQIGRASCRERVCQYV